MLGKPIASGIMLALLVAVGGGALWQEAARAPEPQTASTVQPSEEAKPVEPQPATAPERIVESAGFPITEETTEDESGVTNGPIVTVNGRPLGSPPPRPSTTQTATEPADEPEPDTTPAEPETRMAAVPLPQARPADLPVRPAIEPDYEEVAETTPQQTQTSSSSGTSGEFMSQSERENLAPMPADPNYDTSGGYDPRDDGLVGVVGPNGEVIWVYEDQVPQNNSRVTFQNQASSNPFGFLYD